MPLHSPCPSRRSERVKQTKGVSPGYSSRSGNTGAKSQEVAQNLYNTWLLMTTTRNHKCDQTTRKNGFVTATKLGTTNEFFVASTKNLLQQPNVLLIELNILLL